MKKTLVTLIALVLILSACGKSPAADNEDKTNSETTTEFTSTMDTSEDAVGSVTMLELTLEALAEFDGTNGKPAYVAVDGVIYDMTNSKAWGGGAHNGFQAGRDLTKEINELSPHGTSKLDNVPIIGVLVEAEVKIDESTEAETEEAPMTDTVTETTEEAPVEETITETTEEAPVEETITETTEEVPVEETVTETAKEASVESTTETPSESMSESEDVPPAEEMTELLLTVAELAAYNGKDGMPAYIAVDGIIYDVTHLSPWSGGEHNGNYAGLDLTDDLAYAPHGPEKLKKAIIVGKLVQ